MSTEEFLACIHEVEKTRKRNRGQWGQRQRKDIKSQLPGEVRAEIAQRLEARRLAMGLSKHATAALCLVNESTYRDAEYGRAVSRNSLSHIAHGLAYGGEVGWLLEGIIDE